MKLKENSRIGDIIIAIGLVLLLCATIIGVVIVNNFPFFINNDVIGVIYIEETKDNYIEYKITNYKEGNGCYKVRIEGDNDIIFVPTEKSFIQLYK